MTQKGNARRPVGYYAVPSPDVPAVHNGSDDRWRHGESDSDSGRSAGAKPRGCCALHAHTKLGDQ